MATAEHETELWAWGLVSLHGAHTHAPHSGGEKLTFPQAPLKLLPWMLINSPQKFSSAMVWSFHPPRNSNIRRVLLEAEPLTSDF